MLKPHFVEGGVCALLMSSIFQSAFALTYPRDPFPPIPTPIKPFSTAANSPAASQTKPKILSPAVRPLGLELTFVYSRGFAPGDTTKAEAVQPYKLYSLNIHLPQFTRLYPIENTKLQVPGHFSL